MKIHENIIAPDENSAVNWFPEFYFEKSWNPAHPCFMKIIIDIGDFLPGPAEIILLLPNRD
jgi:hypothetical protein